MINRISLSRAVATATAALGACVLACVLQGVFAGPASAFSPSTTTGSESTPLDFKTPASSSSATGASGGASIVRTIVGLAIVIAVIWGLAWILRQVKAGREGGRGSDSSGGLASVAALTLATGRSVHLVRAGNDYVLLGSTEHGVAPIHRYSEHEAREAGLLPAESGALASEQPAPRSRLLSTAGQIVAGTGRVAVHAGLIGRRELPAPGESSFPGGSYGAFDASARGPAMGRRELHGHSPVVGPRPDPMRMPSPSSGLIERLRELTVRR